MKRNYNVNNTFRYVGTAFFGVPFFSSFTGSLVLIMIIGVFFKYLSSVSTTNQCAGDLF